jgi:signal transduction histidine kinase
MTLDKVWRTVSVLHGIGGKGASHPHEEAPPVSLDPLAAEVAHDAKNLLAVVSGNLEMLRDEWRPAGQRRALTGEIGAAIDLLTAMMNDLLAGGRRHSEECPYLDVGEVVASAGPLLERICGDEVRLHLDTRRGLLARADGVRLQTALLNLARNARDAMPEEGTLHVQVLDLHVGPRDFSTLRLLAGRYAVVSVTDTGEGMPRVCAERAFQPFFTTKRDGTGLGLASVREFVEGLGGRARLRTEAGSGTTIEMFIPVQGDGWASATAADAMAAGSPGPAVKAAEVDLSSPAEAVRRGS